MRLPVDDNRSRKLCLTALLCGTTMLAGCASGGDADYAVASTASAAQAAGTGPAADYPVMVGEPYYVGQTLYTPVARSRAPLTQTSHAHKDFTAVTTTASMSTDDGVLCDIGWASRSPPK